MRCRPQEPPRPAPQRVEHQRGCRSVSGPGDLPQLLKAVQASARADDPLSRSLQDILSDVVPALTRGEPAAVLRSKLEGRLRRAVPQVGIAIGSSPVEAAAGAETIYFGAQGSSGPGVLNVQLPAGYRVSDWEFGCSRPAATCSSCCRQVPTPRPPPTAVRRQDPKLPTLRLRRP